MPRRLRVSRLQNLTLTAGSTIFSWALNSASFVKTTTRTLQALTTTFSWAVQNAILTRQNFYLKALSASFSWAVSPATFTWATSPNITTAPVIIGIPTVGTPVAYTAGNVTGSPVPTRTQQWLLDGNTIASATASTYTPITSDAGHNLSVRQIETNTFGSANRTSAGVAISTSTVFSTPFSATENPISESSKWVNGLAVGLDWSNVLTSGGNALGTRTMEQAQSRFSDDIAIVSPAYATFSNDQWAQATVFKSAGYTGNGGSHEVELLLRFSITGNNAHGYEVLWGIQGYFAVVRWNGVVTDYTPIYDPGNGSIPVPQDGDVLRAEITGNIIKVYRAAAATPNTFVQVGPNVDVSSVGTVYASGQPGIGFWPVDGGVPANMGWKDFTASQPTLVVTPPPSGTMAQDWTARATIGTNGVVQAKRFTTSTDVTAWVHPDGNEANLKLSFLDGIIGDGCLQIDVPASIGANAGGWRIPLNASWNADGQGFGATTFYTQFRWKPGPNRFTPTNGGGGFKIGLFGEYRFSSPNSSHSHPTGEFEVGDYIYTKMPWAYRDSGNVDGSTAHDFTEAFGNDIKLLNAVDNGSGTNMQRYCLYNAGAPSVGCPLFHEQEWHTIDVRISQVSRGGFTGNRFQLWLTYDNSTTRIPLIDASDFSLGSDSLIPNGVNAMWFLPYDTNRTSSSIFTWQRFDQLVVSTNPIATPAARALPSWVPTTIGAWGSIPGTALSSVQPSPIPPGNGPAYKVYAWTGYHADQAGSKLYVCGAGGHNDYGGTEVDVLTLETNTPGWTQLLAPTPTGQLIADSNYDQNGRPQAVHTYQGAQWDPIGRKCMRVGGSQWGGGGGVSNQVVHYDPATNNYSTGANFYAPISGIGVPNWPVATDPRNGNIYIFFQGVVNKWTRGTPGSWSTPITNGSFYAQYGCAEWDSNRNRFLIIGTLGAFNPAHHTYDPDTNTLTAQTFSGAAAGTVQNIEGAAIVFVPSIDAFLVCDGGVNPTVYKIAAGSFTVSTFATTNGGGVPDVVNGPYGKFRYFPRLKCVVYVAEYAVNCFALRVE